MQTIIIGGNENKEEVSTLINEYFSNSKVSIQENVYGDRFEYLFQLNKKKSLEDIALYNKISNLVKDIIIRIYAKSIIKDRVNKICLDYSQSEKEEIVLSTHTILNNDVYFTKEKGIIHEEILNYLIENNTLIIDGFMKFRLNRFLYTIDVSIEKAVGEFEIEKEYLEFLNMLQYFVDIQVPKYDLINVIVKDSGYYLFDKNNEIIENGLLEEIPDDPLYEDVSKADLLISSLIILAPLKLIVHIEEGKEKELISVISQVFRDKLYICNGCDLCKIEVKLKKGK